MGVCSNKVVSVMVIVAILVVARPERSEALNCGDVVSSLITCLNYLKTGTGPSGTCCTGVQTLNKMAVTVPDKRTACACMKQSAKAYAINYTFAKVLPSKCNVHIDYELDINFDCSTINK